MADYIGEISESMKRMAEGAGFHMLAYLLDMVHIEAELARKRMAADLERLSPRVPKPDA